MGKGLAILGLLLIIAGLLPIWATFLTAYVDLSMILVYFDQGIYSLDLAGYTFTEVMLGLTGLGVILLIVGAVK
ncbi:hypothetical protein EU538_06520 [Candidatus Thorarchaeota archaeon]|jgi:hypothetical protein|nr:MAG: hypothetical protein EU538_06520 [Candidatus Thorarchaeota archaeon]